MESKLHGTVVYIAVDKYIELMEEWESGDTAKQFDTRCGLEFARDLDKDKYSIYIMDQQEAFAFVVMDERKYLFAKIKYGF